MLEFKDIALSDRDWINSLLAESDFMGCEYSFANNMAWRPMNKTKISRFKDFYISCSFYEGRPLFTFPAGKGDYRELFLELKKYSEALGAPLAVSSVCQKHLQLFEELFPGQYTVIQNPDYFDYIYLVSDLLELKGKKYHQKRNHLARFYENNWSFEPISPQNKDECIQFSVQSYNEKKAYDSLSSVTEQYAINTFLTYYEELQLQGGVLRVDGQIQGFTIGEKINSNTFCVHIEKANALIQGAYAAINKEFLLASAAGCTYVNREEDLGLEGLRRSKRSYNPCFQLEKSVVTFRTEGSI